MARHDGITTHRFVVVWRAERREIAQADLLWRGWIERIPTPREGDAGATAERISFQSLGELPQAIQTLVDRSAPPRPDTSDRSSRP